MKYVFALFSGIATGVIAILLHQSVPPFGVMLSLLFSYLAIRFIGRQCAGRSFKWLATFGWIAVILRGSTFGIGQELMVQADGVGSTLLLIGTVTVLGAVAARI